MAIRNDRFFSDSFVRMILPLALMLAVPLAWAHSGELSLVKTLRPSGSDNVASEALVAFAGDTALTLYQGAGIGAGSQPWRVWYRNPDSASPNG